MITQDIHHQFTTRLDTLAQLLEKAKAHFEDEETFMTARIIADMVPFGTQIAFTCNQPRHFAQWLRGEAPDYPDPDFTTTAQAEACIAETRTLLQSVTPDDAKLVEDVHLELNTVIVDMPGKVYLNDFLLPNFYFHLVTAYDILRMQGLPIGKADYMRHLHPYITPKETGSA